MTISNEIGTRKIELNITDSAITNFPSYEIKVNLVTEEINAEFNRQIWISLSDLESFTQKLVQLDKTRVGDYKLESMSPDEFYLRFRNIDNLGHLSVELKIKKMNPHLLDYSDSILVEFEIDPTTFPAVIKELNVLKKVS